MQNVTIQLFGAFRQFQPEPQLILPVAQSATVADVRSAIAVYGKENWPLFTDGLLNSSAFATDTDVLKDSASVPANGILAVLPPVAGG